MQCGCLLLMKSPFKKSSNVRFQNIESIKDSIKKSFRTNPHTSKENSIDIRCPYCSDKKYHMGLNFTINAYNCFRCSKSGKLTKFLEYHKIPFSTNIFNGIELSEILHDGESFFEGKIDLFRNAEKEKDNFAIPKDDEVDKQMLSKYDAYLKYRGINRQAIKGKVIFYPITEFRNEYFGYIIVPIDKNSFYGRQYINLPGHKMKHIIRKSKSMIGTPTYLFLDDNNSDTIVVVESFFNLLKLIQNGYSGVCTFGKTNIKSVNEFLNKNKIDKKRTICFCYDSDVDLVEISSFMKKFYKNCNVENNVTFIHPHSMKFNDLAEYDDPSLKKLIKNEQIEVEKIFVQLFLQKYADLSEYTGGHHGN